MLTRARLPHILTLVCLCAAPLFATANTSDDEASRELMKRLGQHARVQTLGELLRRVSQELPPSDLEILKSKLRGAEGTAIALDIAPNGRGSIKAAKRLIPIELGYRGGRAFFRFNQRTIELESATVESIWQQAERALGPNITSYTRLLVPEAAATPLVLAHIGVASVVGAWARVDEGCNSYKRILNECPKWQSEETIDSFLKMAREVSGGQRWAAFYCSKKADRARKCLTEKAKVFDRLVPGDLREALGLKREPDKKKSGSPSIS